MSRTSFPTIAFGTCAKCGRRAVDEGGTSADVPSRSTEKRGLPLTYYHGEWWCDICIMDDKNDDVDNLSADKDRRCAEFRSAAGYVKSI